MALEDVQWPAEYANLLAQYGYAPTPAQGDPLALTTQEYGILGAGQQVPPTPPPPPPDKKFAPPGVPVEETAGPTPAAVPVPTVADKLAEIAQPTQPQPNALQPGLGVPTTALDSFAVQPTVADHLAALSTPVPPPAVPGAPNPADPWAATLGPSEHDPWLDPYKPDLAATQPYVDKANQIGANVWYDTAPVGDVGAVLGMSDPVAYAKWRAETQADQENHATNDRVEAMRKQADWEQKNVAALKASRKLADARTAQADQEAAHMAADGGFWDSRTDGQKLLGLASIFLGGYVAGPGKPNAALDIWEKAIDRHVAMAKQKMADKRSAIAQMYARAGDDFTANETMRLAAAKGMEAQLLQQQQMFNQRGTTAMRIADAIQQTRAAQAESLRKINENEFKQKYEIAKFSLDQQKQIDDVLDRRAQQKEAAKHNRAEEGIGWKNAVTSAKNADTQAQELDVRRAEAEKKQADQLEALDREQGVGGVTSVVDGKPVYGQLKNDDGTTFHVPKEMHKEVIDARTNLLEYLNTMGKLKALRDRVGGANTITSGTEKAEYDRLVAKATISYAKSHGISLADEEDRKFAQSAAIGGDPSSYRIGEVVERLDRGMGEAQQSYVTLLKGTGWHPTVGDESTAVQFVDVSKLGAPTLTESDQAYKDVVGATFGGSKFGDFSMGQLGAGGVVEDRKQREQMQDMAKAISVVNNLETAARTGDKDAITRLQGIVDKAAPQAADIARAALVRLNMPHLTDTGRATQKTTHETMPGTVERLTENEQDRKRREAAKKKPAPPPAAPTPQPNTAQDVYNTVGPGPLLGGK